jgi:hypothetical protein
VAVLERWGGHALKELGYELSIARPRRLPWSFYPCLLWRIAAWRVQKSMRAIRNELWGDELAAVDDCMKHLREPPWLASEEIVTPSC